MTAGAWVRVPTWDDYDDLRAHGETHLLALQRLGLTEDDWRRRANMEQARARRAGGAA